MKTRTLRLALPAATVTLTLAAVVAGLPEPAGQSEAKVHALAGNVSWIEGRGGNIGVSVGKDGVLLIDDQVPGFTDAVEAAVATLSKEKPRYLINTHWHMDHVGGNHRFAPTATILSHTNVRRRLAGDRSMPGRVEDAFDPAALPVVTYDDGVSVHFNGEEIRVRHVGPGHTDGDSVVWFTGSKVVHMGDLFFEQSYPFIDLDSGGSVKGLIGALDDVLDWVAADVRVIPGHGNATDVDGLREYREMLGVLAERVEEALAAGETAQQMVAAGLTSDYDERWGGSSFVPPSRFVETLAKDLAE